MTRGVLLDVPKHRGTAYVDNDSPVHGWELDEIAKSQGVEMTPGDAVVVYCGREAYEAANGNYGGDPVGSKYPGLHASCLPFLRDNDLSVLVWDMEDASPNEYGVAWTVHGAIHAYGMALIDGAALVPLAAECAKANRYEFMLTVNPLILVGGTGSPVNPIAVL
jgi:kynurenine formamidase